MSFYASDFFHCGEFNTSTKKTFPLSTYTLKGHPQHVCHKLLLTALHLFLFEGWLRGFIADYGVPLMVLVWTAISYIPGNNVPRGIPRRLFSPNPWSSGAYSNWTVIKVNPSTELP